jgi:hypothetical protein
MLRPVAYGAFYKEWLSGGIVLVLCFWNYFIMYPRLYKKRRFLAYVLATVFSVMVAASAEVMLVYSQINDFLNMIGDTSPQEYFAVIVISLFLRDLCFVFFFFLIKLLESAYDENRDVNIFLQNTNNLLLARTVDKEKLLVTVRLEDITYCQQDENYAYMYLIDGTKVYRNCSLKSLYELLTPSTAVRVSRRVLVLYSHIVSYDNKSVYVKVSRNDVPVGLEITDAFRQHALRLLRDHCTIVDKCSSETAPSITTVDVIKTSCDILQTETNNNQAEELFKYDDKYTTSSVLTFIQSHPDCKGSDITDHFHTSLSTVNRILAQLKEEGLIEYVGSKKTGGYRVKS